MTSHLIASQSPDATTNESPLSVRLGLIGHGIDHSLAPAFHTSAGQMLGLNVSYELLPRETTFSSQFDEFLIELGQAGYQGVNITVPFKSSGWKTAPDASDEVVTTRVANTVLLGPEGPIKAFNTDFTGFKWAYARHFADAPPGTVAILGAGGVGTATAAALVDLGATIINIFDICPDRSHALATTLLERDGSIQANIADSAEEAVSGAHGVVNGTPVGMYLHPGTPVDLATIARPAVALRRRLLSDRDTVDGAGGRGRTSRESVASISFSGRRSTPSRSSPVTVSHLTFLVVLETHMRAVERERHL